MTLANPSTSAAYEAAVSGAGYFPLSGAGYLRVSGADRQAFLQRQTTNDVRLLSPGRALVTVLTAPTARILDVLTLVAEGDAIAAITLPGRAAETFNYLRSRIFFMDKVTVEDASSDYLQLELLGLAVHSLFQGLGFTQPIEPGQAHFGEVSGVAVWAIHTAELGYRLVVPTERAGAVTAALERAGAACLSPEMHTLLRVESGRPGAEGELVEEYTPLEAGLESAISEVKGCYTGQEVLARQVTYDKITRHLAGLLLERESNPGDPVWAPEGARSAGVITSAATSPRFGPIALAILRRPHHEPGRTLLVGDPENAVSASVSMLPFGGHENQD